MLSEEIRDKLVSAGVVTSGVNFFIGGIPAMVPLPAAMITETGGSAPQETLSHGIPFERASFQIMVKGEPTEAGDTAARRLIRDIWAVLAGGTGLMGVANEVISGVMYQNISARQSPLYIGPDDNNKRMYVANFDVAKEVS